MMYTIVYKAQEKGEIRVDLIRKEIEEKKKELLIAESIFNDAIEREDINSAIYRIMQIEEDLSYLIKKSNNAV